MIIANERVASVKSLATRIAKQGEGLSIREFLDGCALASGTLIKAIYRGPGVNVAIEKYCEILRRSAQQET